jgi:hypothetical protein
MAKSSKPTKKKATAPKVPFYASLLSSQEASKVKATTKVTDSLQTDKFPNDDTDVVYKKEAGIVHSFPGIVTNKRLDQIVITLKYPSDNDEVVTLKYPSDSDENVTRKYPSDHDEIIAASEEIIKGEMQTHRYPSDVYCVAADAITGYKPKKGSKVLITKPSVDTIQTMKYPSDGDETILDF